MKKLFKVVSVIILVMFIVASFVACNSAETKHFYVYGTVLEVTASTDNEMDDVYKYISNLENILSPVVEGSDLYKINHSTVGEKIQCNDVTMDIMKKAENIYNLSNGAYDPSVYPLVRLWNFSSDRFMIYDTIPSNSEIEETMKAVGLSSAFSIDYEAKTITKLKDGAMLDFGGVAKGYVAQMSRQYLKDKGLINLGGNITGTGKEFTIGIANPSREDRKTFRTSYFCKVQLPENMCIATSGDYERYYEKDGVIYNHIINPFTGRPQDTNSSIISCSIISEDGGIGDAVATAVIVLGKEEGIKLINALNLKAVLIDYEYNATNVNIEMSLA